MAIIVSNPSISPITGLSADAPEMAGLPSESGFPAELKLAMGQEPSTGHEAESDGPDDTVPSVTPDPVGLQILPPGALLHAVTDANFAPRATSETPAASGPAPVHMANSDPALMAMPASAAVSASVAPQPRQDASLVTEPAAADVPSASLASAAADALPEAQPNIVALPEGVAARAPAPAVVSTVQAAGPVQLQSSPTLLVPKAVSATTVSMQGPSPTADMPAAQAAALSADPGLPAGLQAVAGGSLEAARSEPRALSSAQASAAASLAAASAPEFRMPAPITLPAPAGVTSAQGMAAEASGPQVGAGLALPPGAEASAAQVALQSSGSSASSAATSQAESAALPVPPAVQTAAEPVAGQVAITVAQNRSAAAQSEASGSPLQTISPSGSASPQPDSIGLQADNSASPYETAFRFDARLGGRAEPQGLQSAGHPVQIQAPVVAGSFATTAGSQPVQGAATSPGRDAALTDPVLVAAASRERTGAAPVADRSPDPAPLAADAASPGFDEVSTSFVSSLVGGAARPVETVMDWINLQTLEKPAPLAPHQVRLDAGAVQVEIQRMVRQGGGQVVMELTPPDQSKFTIELRLDDKGGASLVVEGLSDSTRSRLEQSAPQLQQQFEQMGLSLQLDMRQQRETAFAFDRQGQQDNTASGATDGRSAGATVSASESRTHRQQALAEGQIHLYA